MSGTRTSEARAGVGQNQATETRRELRRGLLAPALVLLAATVVIWTTSLVYIAGYFSSDLVLQLNHGIIAARIRPDPFLLPVDGYDRWMFRRLAPVQDWRQWSGATWPFVGAQISRCDIVVPLWLPTLALSGLLLWAATVRRTLPPNARACGYDLMGNVSGNCPECGQPTRSKV